MSQRVYIVVYETYVEGSDGGGTELSIGGVYDDEEVAKLKAKEWRASHVACRNLQTRQPDPTAAWDPSDNTGGMIATVALEDAERKHGSPQALRTEGLVSAWRSGLRRKVPVELQYYEREATHRVDPEYQAYERLKAKFESCQ